MTRKCIPLYKPVVNGNITFWERRQSSTLITSLCSSYRHRGSCRTTPIKSGPPTCNSSISTSSIIQGAQIMSLTASVNLSRLHSPLCSIPMDMRHLSGPNFINKIQTSPPPINSWVHARMSLIFTFRTWTIMPYGPSLCSCKRACKHDLGIPLQSDGRTFWHGENCGCSTETFLLAKTLTGCQQVYHILHCLCHCQANHQEARIIHPSSYYQEYLGIHIDGLHVWPSVHQARK
jgi:hypothetical protein